MPRIISSHQTPYDRPEMSVPALLVYIDTRRLSTYAILAFILGGVLGGVLWNYSGIYVPPLSKASGFGSMQRFTSYEELKNYLNEHGTRSYSYGWGVVLESVAVPVASSSDAARGTESSVGSYSDFSGTNVQVEGVDEADMVKTDGTYIYLAKDQSVIIVKAYPPGDAGIVGRIEVARPVQDLYIAGDKLVVFSHYQPVFRETLLPDILPPGKEGATVSVYDVANHSEPVLDREFTVDGRYFNSRMMGDYVYLIIKSPAYVEEDEVILPVVREGKEWYKVAVTEIYHPNVTRGWLEYNMVMALNAQDPDAPISSETFLLDSGSTLYVSPSHLYITSQGWSDKTTIHKIMIDRGEITFRANGTVPGYVLNQFSMDEHRGNFRIATTSSGWRNSGELGNNVYVLDEEMNVMGSLTGLAPGESIYSARFMGDRCYLVTFKQVDPLFTIDLSDPEEPRVLGKLKIPGFSNYLHPYDENILIGIGQETEEAKQGDFAWFQGVKISLFDVSDVEDPRELAKIEIGDRGSMSPAQWDHHAFLFSRDRNLLVIPVLEAQIDEDDFAGGVPPNFYGEYVYQGAYVFDVSPGGIELRGRVTHIDDDQAFLKSGYWFESMYAVERSLYIHEALYTISQGKIRINSLEDLSPLGEVSLD